MWYCIFNTYGDEMCNTGSVLLGEEPQALAEVFLILTAVNGSDVVEIDGMQRQVVWK